MDTGEDGEESKEDLSSVVPLLKEFASFSLTSNVLANNSEQLLRCADILSLAVEEIRDYEAKKKRFLIYFTFQQKNQKENLPLSFFLTFRFLFFSLLPDSKELKESIFSSLGNLLSTYEAHLGLLLPKVLKNLLRPLTLTKKGNQPQTIPRNFFQISEISLSFISSILTGPLRERHPDVVEEKALILLQHVSTSIPDRVEHRSHASQVLLLLFFPFLILPFISFFSSLIHVFMFVYNRTVINKNSFLCGLGLAQYNPKSIRFSCQPFCPVVQKIFEKLSCRL